MPETPDSSLIHARGLTKRFGDFIAVDGIDFDVQPGEAFGFLGPNGAGKTSTMRMIGCISPISDGELPSWAWTHGRHGPQIRARLGVVPQNDTLDNELTVRENLIIYGRYFGLPRGPSPPAAPTSCSTSSSCRPGKRPRRAAIGRHEAAAHDRPTPDQRAGPDAPRRADDRPRPTGPPPALGPPVPAQAAGRHPRPDDPLHGRGGAAVRSARRHGQGQDRGRGFAAGADPAATPPRRSPSSGSRRASRTRSTASSTGSRERIEQLPDRILLYADDGEDVVIAARTARPPSRDGARPPLDARGRLPPPDRPLAGRIDGLGHRVRPAAPARRPGQLPARRPARRHRAPRPAVPADVPRLAVQQLRDRPCCSCSRWASGSAVYVDQKPDAAARRRDLSRSSWPRACSRRAVMQSASFEAAFPILGGLQWNRPFHAMFATPLPRRATSPSGTSSGSPSGRPLVAGLLRGDRGLRREPVPADRARDPRGRADGPVVRGADHGLHRHAANAGQFAPLFRFGITPLFLFCGTFFPIESLPELIRADCLALPPVAWRRPAPRADARDGRPCAAARLVHVGVLSRSRSARRSRPRAGRSSPAGEGLGGDAMTVLLLIAARSRSAAGGALRIIERNLLVYKHGWLVLSSPASSSRCSTCSRSGSGSACSSATSPARAARRSRTRRSWRRRCSARGDERRDHRVHVQLLLQAQLRQESRADPDDADVARGRVALGELCWALIRGGLYTIGFLGVMVVFGLARSPLDPADAPGGDS